METTNTHAKEDKVVVILIFCGIFGGIALSFVSSTPPILVAVLVAFGVAAAVYRYFGGIEGATFIVGGVKLAGTMAAVLGTAMFVQHYLVEGSTYRIVSNQAMVGDWLWDYPQEGWRTRLTFTEQDGKLVFSGNVEQVYEVEKPKILYVMTEGVARIVDGKHLWLHCKVQDLIHNRELVWTTSEPLLSGLAFKGSLKVDMEDAQDQSLQNERWGIGLYKALD